jgi:hypothetical protein
MAGGMVDDKTEAKWAFRKNFRDLAWLAIFLFAVWRCANFFSSEEAAFDALLSGISTLITLVMAAIIGLMVHSLLSR